MQLKTTLLLILSLFIFSFTFLLPFTPSVYSQEGENPNCPADCGDVCGNRYCNASAGETSLTCPQDCGTTYNYCGDRICQEGENATCPADCGTFAYCGDAVCNNEETSATCPRDCVDATINCQTCGNRGYVCNYGLGAFCSEIDFTARGYLSCTACTATPTEPPVLTGMTLVGYATLNGVYAPGGTTINALINGKVCGTTTTWTFGESRDGYAFNFQVKSSHEEAGCGTNGATINFTVGGVSASNTVSFASGSTQYVTLNATGPVTTPTPTPPTNDCPLKGSGDANCDGNIDLLDFNMWRDYFVASGPGDGRTLQQVDFNGDGTIDLLDFNIWKDGFSNGVRAITPTATPVVDAACQTCKDQGMPFRCQQPGANPICTTEANASVLSSQRGGYTCSRCY